MSRKKSPLKPWLRAISVVAAGGAVVVAADLAGNPGGPLSPDHAHAALVCPPANATTPGLDVKIWYGKDVNDAGTQLPLTKESFTDAPDGNGFPTRKADINENLNTKTAGGDSGEFGRQTWDALRADGWVSAPCAAESWELRFQVGKALGTYAGALKQNAQAKAADILTPGGIEGVQINSTTEIKESKPISLNLHDPVNVVELIEDRGGSHRMVLQERVDSTGADAWVEVPAERIWEEKPPPRENPVPVVTSTTPDTLPVGSPARSITITGTNFLPSSTVEVGGAARPAKYVSDTELSVTLPAALLAVAGLLPVTVTTPGPGGGTSAPGQVTVGNPIPAITGISPTGIAAGSGEVVISVTGTGFNSSTTLAVGATAIATTLVTPTRLMATIPAASLATAGALQVTASNPAPGGGSASTTFTVAPRPAQPPTVAPGPAQPPSVSIAGVGPFSGPPGARGAVAGSGFGPRQGASIVTLGGVSLGRALLWRDSRIEFKVPDLPAGAYPVQIIVDGNAVTIGQYIVEAIEPEPPTPNPVLFSGGGAKVIFDASLSINPDSGATAQGLGRLRSQAVGISGITAVIWRFGDGTSSKQVAPEKTYTAPGAYNASLTVTDTAGRSSTVGQRIIVTGSKGNLRVSLPPVNLSIPDRVVFDAGSSAIRDESKPTLLNLARLLGKIGRRAIVGGHTDSVGPAGYNLRLSEDRARAVRRFLTTEGKISPLVLVAVGFGESQPIDTNDTPLGRQRNRRVTLQVARSQNPIRLNGRSLLINRRISTAVLLREKAIRDRLTRGLGPGDILDGVLYDGNFGSGVEITGEENAASPPPVKPERIRVPKLPKPKKLPLFNRKELSRNNQLNRAAILRVNALIDRLEKGLTGADVKDGAISRDKLAPGLSFGAVTASTAPGATPFTVVNVPLRPLGPGRITEAMLQADQRRAQTAIRRLNVLLAQFREGFSVDDFAPGSLSSVDVDTK